MPSHDEIYEKVKATLIDALGVDDEEVTPSARLKADLGAESIDFLDMVFRLERAFKIKVPRGKIIEDVRGEMPVEEFEQGGVLTEKGLARLREYLAEIPEDRFKLPMRVDQIARLYTPETFCKLVIRAQRAAQAAG